MTINMDNQTSILQLVGEPVGGIRKHVHALLFGLNGFKLSYMYASNGVDNSFLTEVEKLSSILLNIEKMVVNKKPRFSDLINILRVVLFCRKNKINLIHAHGAKAGLYARMLKLFRPAKIVYTPHGGVLHDAFSPFMAFLYIFIEKMMMPLTDTLVFESEYSRDKYFEKVGVPSCSVFVNYNGVSKKHVKFSWLLCDSLIKCRNDCFNIGVFARFHFMKGQDLAVKMMQLLPSNFMLHLYGDGSTMSDIKNLVDTLGLSTRVVFYGDVSNPEEYIGCMDVVLIPSLFESFSYVATESMMMGVPVIASAVGGLIEVLDHGNAGILVKDRIPESFAEQILRLQSDNELRTVIINAAKIRQQTFFDQDVMVSRVAEIYKYTVTVNS